MSFSHLLSVKANGNPKPFRVVSAQSRVGPGLFWPGSFRPWVVSANFGGPFRPDFLSLPRLQIINRTIIWLFDEESNDVKGLFFKSL